MKLRVLTLNVGLLKLLGRSWPTPFMSERLAALPGQLRKMECDLILIQEIYEHSSRQWLAESLRDIFPYAIYPKKKRHMGLPNGLMVLSRDPASGYLELFRDAPLDEVIFDSKGIMITQHRSPGDVTLTVINLHTTVGGVFKHPEDPRIDSIRAKQIEQILERASSYDSPLVIAGDLNAGPGVSEVNFQQVLDAGFVSVHDLLHDGTTEATWDPKNVLNAAGPHNICPPQRIDHIFIRTDDFRQDRIRPLASAICLQTPVVRTEGNIFVTVSDHYGICVEIDISY